MTIVIQIPNAYLTVLKSVLKSAKIVCVMIVKVNSVKNAHLVRSVWVIVMIANHQLVHAVILSRLLKKILYLMIENEDLIFKFTQFYK